MLNDPDPDKSDHQPIRADVAHEFKTDKEEFLKKASEFTRKYGEPRQNAENINIQY